MIGAISVYCGSEKASPLMQAIVSLAIGLILPLWTGISAKLFLILVGIWLALQGVGLFMAAMKMDVEDEGRGLTMVIGGVMAGVGLVFIFWPDTGVVGASSTISFIIAGANRIGILKLHRAID